MRLSDWLYAETEDACALCGIKGGIVLTEHHIDEDRSNNRYDNLIVLCYNCHNGYHGKRVITDKQIESAKRHLIQKTLTVYGLNALKIADRNNVGVAAMPFLLYHLVDLGYMTMGEGQMGLGVQDDAISLFAITDEGRKLLAKWFA